MKEAYTRILPNECSPFSRTDIPALRDAIRVFVPPKCKAEQFINNKRVQNLNLESETDIYNQIGSLKPGTVLMTVAPAGHGKSTLYGRLTADWRDGHPALQRFDHVYLMIMRNVHNTRSPLENIICNDLKLLDSSIEGQVRRSLKFQFTLILIDGYDEILETERAGSTINQLLTGKHKFRSIVLVSTRPHCKQEIATLTGGNYIYLPLRKLDDEGMNKYCSIFFKDDSRKTVISDLIMNSPFIRKDVIRIPMFLALACVMYKLHRVEELESSLGSMGSVLATFWCMLMGMKEEKDRRQTNVILYKTLNDRHISQETRMVLSQVARMCYKCLQKTYIFVPFVTACQLGSHFRYDG